MGDLSSAWDRRGLLTRISVSGSGGSYVVRNGDAAPVRVWVRPGGAECECGRGECVHVKSLQMCGFLEPTDEGLQAA